MSIVLLYVYVYMSIVLLYVYVYMSIVLLCVYVFLCVCVCVCVYSTVVCAMCYDAIMIPLTPYIPYTPITVQGEEDRQRRGRLQRAGTCTSIKHIPYHLYTNISINNISIKPTIYILISLLNPYPVCRTLTYSRTPPACGA
jgi:hypothetical protein